MLTIHFIGFFDYTVILTFLGCASSAVGIFLAVSGNVKAAVLCLIFSGICDLFDGAVARTKKGRTADEKNFGIQIDSLSDLVSFGVFPAVLLYFHGVDGAAGIILLAVFVLCALIRLAFFNVLEMNRQKSEDGCAKAYRGLPVTSTSIILPLFFACLYKAGGSFTRVFYFILTAVIAFLFILDFRVPKVDIGKLFKKKS